jgi:transcriptional regulator with XRE-family HTH domain
MAVGDVGKRIREAREALRPVQNITWLAARLNVSHSRLSSWERGRHDPPADVIAQASKVLHQPIAFFYGEAPLAIANQQNSVYYKEELDSAPSDAIVDTAKQLLDPSTIRVAVAVVDPGNPWSAKGAQRLTLNLLTYVAGSRPMVRLAGPALKFPSGTVLVFQPDPFPTTDVYLLLENRANPDIQAVAWIDAEGDSTKLTLEGQSEKEPLQNWTVLGYAWATIQNPQLPNADYRIRPSGIGPRTAR